MSKTIQALVAFAFSPNGVTVEKYSAGQVAEVSDACADDAIHNEWAKEVTPEDIARARAAHEKLQKAADKAEAAADKAEADAQSARAAAVVARELVNTISIGLDAEAAAAGLED